MKKLLQFILLIIGIAAYGQQPAWYDHTQRSADYPTGEYFTGFAEGQKQNGESTDAAIKRLTDAARAEAAATIRVHVKNNTTTTGLSRTIKDMEGTFRQSTREIKTNTSTSTDMKITGLQVETWQNPQNGNIAAFAWVKKATLIRQLEKTITVELTKIETALDQINQLLADGQKMQARNIAEGTLPRFEQVDEAQKTLAVVDENADEESLQLGQTRELQSRLTQLAVQLKHGINIYIDCKADMFGTAYNTLKGEIQGQLSSLGCTFVSSAADSDWAIYINASAREYNKATFGNTNTYFCYVDADIAVEKTATGARIYEDRMSVKGGHTISYEQAARQGYKDISPKLSDIIKQQIQQ